MTKPKGTLLIRELIDSNELIKLLQDPEIKDETEDYYTNDGLNILDRIEVKY